VYYPISGDGNNENNGRLFIYGDKDAKNVVLFCAGYPDDQGSFSTFAQRLSKEADCLCGVACLIGYDDYPKRPYTSYRPEGYSFDEMTVSLRAAAKALKVYSSSNPGANFITVFHDWGSVVGAYYTNRALEEGDALVSPDKIVYFDVLPVKLHPKDTNTVAPASKTVYEQLVEVTYRIVLAKVFLIQRFISKYLAAFVFLLSFTILPLVGLVPKSPLDDKIMEQKKTSLFRIMYMAFPYYYMFRSMLGFAKDTFLDDFHLPLLQETPVLYLYGVDKGLQFHDENIVEYLQAEGKKKDSMSNVIAVHNAAHWLYLQQPDVCLKAVKDFIVS
jgi:pimeloyl-ACP methyl ester carboxylesterase